MFRPLAIGLPIVIIIVIAFVVAMNTVPIQSPYFTYVIVGYVVLFPLALLFTIVGTIRAAKRMVAGGDATLKERGERTMATVVTARPLNMTMRVSGGPQMSMTKVRLKPDNHTPDISTTRAGTFFQATPQPGDRVPLYLDRDNAKNFFVDWDQSSAAQGQSAPGGPGVQVLGNMSGNLAGMQLGDLVSQIQAAVMKARASGESQVTNIQTVNLGSPQTFEAAEAHEPPIETYDAGAGGLEGRARIEGLKPYPDGTYDLDLYVTPRGKSSYRVAARVPVPAGTGLLEKGQTLNVRIDPDIASRIEVVWG